MTDYTQNGRFVVYEITELPVDIEQLISDPDDAAGYVDDRVPNCYLQVEDLEQDGRIVLTDATPDEVIEFLKKQAKE